jgi:hypothetical protein
LYKCFCGGMAHFMAYQYARNHANKCAACQEKRSRLEAAPNQGACSYSTFYFINYSYNIFDAVNSSGYAVSQAVSLLMVSLPEQA